MFFGFLSGLFYRVLHFLNACNECLCIFLGFLLFPHIALCFSPRFIVVNHCFLFLCCLNKTYMALLNVFFGYIIHQMKELKSAALNTSFVVLFLYCFFFFGSIHSIFLLNLFFYLLHSSFFVSLTPLLLFTCTGKSFSFLLFS